MEKFKITLTDANIEIPRDKVQELVRFLEMDEIVDSMEDKSQIKALIERLCMDYWQEISDLLHDFLLTKPHINEHIRNWKHEGFMDEYKEYLMNRYKTK